jgi:hypothetical protein
MNPCCILFIPVITKGTPHNCTELTFTVTINSDAGVIYGDLDNWTSLIPVPQPDDGSSCETQPDLGTGNVATLGEYVEYMYTNFVFILNTLYPGLIISSNLDRETFTWVMDKAIYMSLFPGFDPCNDPYKVCQYAVGASAFFDISFTAECCNS